MSIGRRASPSPRQGQPFSAALCVSRTRAPWTRTRPCKALATRSASPAEQRPLFIARPGRVSPSPLALAGPSIGGTAWSPRSSFGAAVVTKNHPSHYAHASPFARQHLSAHGRPGLALDRRPQGTRHRSPTPEPASSRSRSAPSHPWLLSGPCLWPPPGLGGPGLVSLPGSLPRGEFILGVGVHSISWGRDPFSLVPMVGRGGEGRELAGDVPCSWIGVRIWPRIAYPLPGWSLQPLGNSVL